jgi:hypothetical protein
VRLVPKIGNCCNEGVRVAHHRINVGKKKRKKTKEKQEEEEKENMNIRVF